MSLKILAEMANGSKCPRRIEMKIIKSFLADESGASAAEYVLILALIGLAIIAGATALGTQMGLAIDQAATTVQGAI